MGRLGYLIFGDSCLFGAADFVLRLLPPLPPPMRPRRKACPERSRGKPRPLPGTVAARAPHVPSTTAGNWTCAPGLPPERVAAPGFLLATRRISADTTDRNARSSGRSRYREPAAGRRDVLREGEGYTVRQFILEDRLLNCLVDASARSSWCTDERFANQVIKCRPVDSLPARETAGEPSGQDARQFQQYPFGRLRPARNSIGGRVPERRCVAVLWRARAHLSGLDACRTKGSYFHDHIKDRYPCRQGR